MKVEIQINVLKAAIVCTATKDIRYHLQCVCLDFRHLPVPRLNVVATNGSILCAYKQSLNYRDGEQTADFQLLLPSDTIKQAIKAANRKQDTITLESLDDGTYMLGNIRFTAVNGQFLDYQRVIPQHDTQVAPRLQQFDADLLAKGQESLRLRYGDAKRNFRVTHFDNGFAVIHQGSSDSVVVIAGLRDNAFAQEQSDRYQGFFA